MKARPVRMALAAVAGALAIAATATWLAWPYLSPHAPGRVHYVGSESMMPTLVLQDQVAATRLAGAVPPRGAVVMVRWTDSDRLFRVVGLPGETVATVGRQVVIDGRPTGVRERGVGPQLADGEATLIDEERLPGEARPHFVLHTPTPSMPDVPPRRVPRDALFLLGDNRDRSADSRFPPDEGGVGLVPLDRVIGVVEATLWSSRDNGRGRPLDRLDLTTARRSQ